MLLGARGPVGPELYDSIMSTRWSVCSALAAREYSPATVLRFDQPDLARDALIARSSVVHDPELDQLVGGGTRCAKLSVRMADGRLHEIAHRRQLTGDTISGAHRGSMGHVDEPALTAKFQMLTAGHRAAADRLATALTQNFA